MIIMNSKVYFTNLKTKDGYNLLDKLEKLVKEAGIKNIDFKGKFVAIKIHFGEPGNLAYIRPNYARRIVKIIKELGGKPFLTDSNTLYVGRRANALDHLESAFENGFNPMVTDCNVIIADGLKGNDYVDVDVPNAEYCKKAKIGTAIDEADIIISMNHFKGHPMTGFGGAFKNLGMGCGSRIGKLDMHSSAVPIVNVDKCTSCGECSKKCSQKAISFVNKKANIDLEKCIGCGQCITTCNYEAITSEKANASEVINKKIAEYTYAVVNNKPCFHINFIMNVSPHCDCASNNDIPLIPDIGIMASFDPVALDRASVDMTNEASVTKGSVLDDKIKNEVKHVSDKFSCIHPDTNWKVGLEHAEKLGIGTQKYEIIELE